MAAHPLIDGEDLTAHAHSRNGRQVAALTEHNSRSVTSAFGHTEHSDHRVKRTRTRVTGKPTPRTRLPKSARAGSLYGAFAARSSIATGCERVGGSALGPTGNGSLTQRHKRPRRLVPR
jgi:hypothetical protein